MRRVLVLLWCLTALWLSGCAALSTVTSRVDTYGNWPQGRAPGTYAFERLPSQQSHPQEQAVLEAAMQPALAEAGFKPADKPEQADVDVQVAGQTDVHFQAHRFDPFWGMPYGYGSWAPWPGRPGWVWGGPAFAYNPGMDPPHTAMEVHVLIRDHRTHQVLYETHAEHHRMGGADDRLFQYLFEAAMKDFPNQAVSPRNVSVPVQRDDR